MSVWLIMIEIWGQIMIEAAGKVSELQKRLADLDDRIRHMENDVRNCPQASHGDYDGEMREIRSQYQNFMREVPQKKQ